MASVGVEVLLKEEDFYDHFSTSFLLVQHMMLMTRLLSDPPCGSVFHQGILLKMNIQNGITQDEIVHKVTKCSNMGRDCAPGLLSYRS